MLLVECLTEMDSLLRFVSLGLGGDVSPSSLSSSEILMDLLDLATRQGVDAIAFDGIQKELESDNEIASFFNQPENKTVKYNWFGQALSAEVKFDRQFKAASELSALWASHGIKPVIMKGLAYARFYPVPQHRYCSDLDCFLFDRWEDGNALIETKGVKVRRGFYKNSSFTFKGLYVENHRFCSPIRGGKRKKEYELFLRDLLERGPLTPLEGTDFLCPPPMFDTVFFMSHAQNHFLTEGGIRLRHVCDWAMLMKAYISDLDWDAFLTNCERFGLRKFAESISQVAKKVCGVEIPFDCPIREKADAALLEEILNPTSTQVEFSRGWHTRWQLIRSNLSSGWKFRLFSDQSMLGSLLSTSWAYLFEKEPELK